MGGSPMRGGPVGCEHLGVEAEEAGEGYHAGIVGRDPVRRPAKGPAGGAQGGSVGTGNEGVHSVGLPLRVALAADDAKVRADEDVAHGQVFDGGAGAALTQLAAFAAAHVKVWPTVKEVVGAEAVGVAGRVPARAGVGSASARRRSGSTGGDAEAGDLIVHAALEAGHKRNVCRHAAGATETEVGYDDWVYAEIAGKGHRAGRRRDYKDILAQEVPSNSGGCI